MVPTAGKLPSEAKPRLVNYDLGHSFFFVCDKKTRLFRTRNIREIRAFGLLTRKYFIKFYFINKNSINGTVWGMCMLM